MTFGTFGPDYSPMVNWKKIELIAEHLGVEYEARKKWRQRGRVPHKYRLPIKEMTGGEIKVFEERRDRRRQDART